MKSLKVLVFLACIAWIAHFFYFRHFGLYEDDYAHIAPAMGWDLAALLRHARVFVTWPQGRPIHFFLPRLFSFIGAGLGGLHTVYVIGFIIVTLNAFLFYILMERTIRSEVLALTGALAFCLFPADTTHTLLTHALTLQTSLMFLLIASLCYLSGKRKISYLVALGALLTYESPFMVFFGIPLLKDKWDRSLVREYIGHAVILSGIILGVVGIRMFTGDERLMMMRRTDIFLVPVKILASVVIGPFASLLLFFYRPARTISHWNTGIALVFVMCLGVFLWQYHRLRIDSIDERSDYPLSFHSKVFTLSGSLQAPIYYAGVAKLFLAGIMMLCLAYVVSFTYFPPIATFGRGTGVHLAAAFGGSIIFACLCSLFLSMANAYGLKRYAIMVLSLYLSLVVGYRFSIQQDFKQSWQNQRWFWTSVIENSPDMTDGTVILVLRDDLPKTRYILTNSWADPFILEQIYQFPKHWKNPPRLLVVGNNWTQNVIMRGEEWTMPWVGYYEFTLQDSNVILLQMVDDKLIRADKPVIIRGRTLELKPMQPIANSISEKGALFRYLISDSGLRSR